MLSSFNILKKKIKDRKAKICIIGLGYVGLPLALKFSQKGFFVYGLDTNKNRIDSLLAGCWTSHSWLSDQDRS